jgi:hypothetical protein
METGVFGQIDALGSFDYSVFRFGKQSRSGVIAYSSLVDYSGIFSE